MSGWAPNWCAYPPDDCTCRWINFSDGGGWELRGRRKSCPHHGDEPGKDDDGYTGYGV